MYVELVKCIKQTGVGVVRLVATAMKSWSVSSKRFIVFVVMAWIVSLTKIGISILNFGRGGGFDGDPETGSSIPGKGGINVAMHNVEPLTKFPADGAHLMLRSGSGYVEFCCPGASAVSP